MTPSRDRDPVPPASARPPRRGSWLLDWLVRLLLLGFGVTFAGAIGLILAMNQADIRSVRRPWFLQIAEFGRNLLGQVTGADTQPTLAAEVVQLNRELTQLRDRVTILESQFGLSPTQEALETRMTRLLQTSENAEPALSQSIISPSPLPGTRLKVTLPSDLLFDENNQLSSDGTLILDAVVTDLQAYEGSTIRVAAYTSGAQSPDEERELAFQLAKTVEQYLASALRGRYRWVSVGYGSTRPLVAVDNLENQARNRRIEIAVD